MQKSIDGIRLAYDDAGHGDVLVLLHGFPFDRTLWDAQFAALTQRARVIRVDLRGSGESGAGVGPALMESLAGDVYGLLDALGVARAIIAGHSMGGYAALAYFRMYAERVAGLALIASHVAADTPARRSARDEQAAYISAHGMTTAAARVADYFSASFAAANPATLERIRLLVARQDPTGEAALLLGMKERVDSGDLLADIAVPALIVAGGDDRGIAPATLEQTAAAIADCEFVVLPDCAHMPMLEAPEATTGALERLLARCATARAASRSARADPA
jgi:pimeloyl-ACP methyl ester carboxylesterase